MPMCTLNEAVNMPHSDLSHKAQLHRIALGKYTHIGEHKPEMIKVLRHDVTKNINKDILPEFQDEARVSIGEELATTTTDAWVELSAHTILTRIVIRLNARIFAGLPLCRNQDYLDLTTKFSLDAGTVIWENATVNPLLRPLVARWLPSVQIVREDLKKAKDWMQPLIAEILEDAQLGNDMEKRKPLGTRLKFIRWMLQHLPERERTAEVLGTNQLLVRSGNITILFMQSGG